MQKFKDEHGNEWELKLTIGAAKRLRDIAGISIFAPNNSGGETVSDNVLTAMEYDDVCLMEIVSCLLSPQLLEKGITEAEFVDEATGVTVKNARKALGAEVVNFSQQTGRTNLARNLKMAMEMKEKMTQRIAEQLSHINVESTVSELFTQWQERWESSRTT